MWVALKRAVITFTTYAQAALRRHLCLGLVRLLGEKDSLDVGENTTLGDGHTSEKFVQLLIVADSQLKVTGDDTGLLVVTGGVASQLENLSSEVFEDGGR